MSLRMGLVVLLTSGLLAAPGAARADDRVLCSISAPGLQEISGLAYSPRHSGIVWTHNDSGGGAKVYALDTATCEVRATVTLGGMPGIDPEAIAASVNSRGRPVLWLADIGDNSHQRPRVFLYRFIEPDTLTDQTVQARKFVVRYPKPVDAEALLVGPKALWIISKDATAGAVWKVRLPLRKKVNRARKVGSEGAFVSDTSMAPDGRHFVVRDYSEARVYRGLPPGLLVDRFALPGQIQGEAITWTLDGRGFLVASERDPRLIQVPWSP
ncbi:MAG: hypothetical protein VW239_03860 [Candidatus Nanopelagicales bacterium]